MSLTKPPVLPVWADAGDKVQPSNTELPVGWPLSNTPPARQRWNWVLNFLMNGVRYFTRRGMPDYGNDETYMIGDRVIGDDGKTYRSIQDTNLNHTPSSSPLWWERWGYSSTEMDALLAGKATQFQVRVASSSAVNLASPGAAIDGVTMVAGDRFLEKDNATGASRGIYVWNGAAVAATRATDADSGTELKSGSTIAVAEGTSADSVWMLSTDGAITIGVTGLTFVLVAGSTGFAKTGSVNTFTKGQVGSVTALPATTGTVTLDLTASNNWEGTLTGNITLANPSSMPIGQSGVIRIVNDATPRTIAYGSYFKSTVGSLPALTATAGAVDLLPYYVESANRIWIGVQGDSK